MIFSTVHLLAYFFASSMRCSTTRVPRAGACRHRSRRCHSFPYRRMTISRPRPRRRGAELADQLRLLASLGRLKPLHKRLCSGARDCAKCVDHLLAVHADAVVLNNECLRLFIERHENRRLGSIGRELRRSNGFLWDKNSSAVAHRDFYKTFLLSCLKPGDSAT